MERKTIQKLSVILPIHNEEKLLPVTLPSIYRLAPDEVIILFDRCTDNSEKIAASLVEIHQTSGETRFVNIEESETDYVFRHAFLRKYGTGLAKHEWVMWCNSDIIFDHEIRKYFFLLDDEKMGLLSFLHLDYPITWRNLIIRLMVKLKISQFPTAGTMIFRKKAVKETEDPESLKRITVGQDTHLYQAISRKYVTKSILSKNLHLRPYNHAVRDLKCGVAYREQGLSFFRVLFNTVLLMRFKLLIGYLSKESED